MNDALERMWRRVLLLIGRGRVALVDDAGGVQVLQVQLGADEVKDGTPRLAEYGFQSNPPAGADAVLLFLAGERGNGVAIACGHQQYRMRGLATGEVAISDDKGQSVYLSAAGIRIDGGGKPIEIVNTPSVTIDAPVVTMTGDLEVAGNVSAGGNVDSGGNVTAVGNVADQAGASTMAGMRGTYNSHKHGSSVTPTPTM